MKPTCVLQWTKTEAGVSTEGSQPFWAPMPEVMTLVRKFIRDQSKRGVGGAWQHTLKDSEGKEVSLAEEPEPVEFR